MESSLPMFALMDVVSRKKKKEKSSTYAMAERKNAYCISIMRVPAKLKEHSKKVQTC